MSAVVVTHSVDLREHATILAALRYWQRHQANSVGTGGLRFEDNIATDGGTFKALNNDEIDDLCLKLNTQ
jgi:uncharacterized protein YaaW (UPF0174 family)